MALRLVTAPAEEPVALEDAKAHLRVDGADDDALIGMLITVARQQAEALTRRALVTQEWLLTLDRFPRVIDVPMPRLQSVTSIKYIDENGVQQTLDPAQYKIDAETEPGRIAPVFGAAWPVTRCEIGAVSVQYQAGFGVAAAVPQPIRQWMLLKIGALYENREAIVIGTNKNIIAELPYSFVDGLLDPYMVVTV